MTFFSRKCLTLYYEKKLFLKLILNRVLNIKNCYKLNENKLNRRLKKNYFEHGILREILTNLK